MSSNRHLLNDGVRESPPVDVTYQASEAHAEITPEDLHADLTEANVGFRNWHPMPVTQNGDKLAGLAEMGGLWEATSSPLTKKKGFAPMTLYPAYSGKSRKPSISTLTFDIPQASKLTS